MWSSSYIYTGISHMLKSLLIILQNICTINFMEIKWQRSSWLVLLLVNHSKHTEIVVVNLQQNCELS